MGTTKDWAEETFGGADLGDRRRTQRLVALGRAVSRRPSGRVTEVFHEPAAREAAFRFVENDAVSHRAIAHAVHLATARRCRTDSVVIVPVDQSSLVLTDYTGRKGFGRTGTTNVGQKTHHPGLHAMTALAIAPSGESYGVIGQAWWNRHAKAPDFKFDDRPIEQRESGMWTDVIEQAISALKTAASGATPWFQLDRGGDATHVLQHAVRRGYLITVRSSHDRALVDGGYLARHLRRRPIVGRYSLSVPERRDRRARRASMVVRFSPVRLRMTHQCSGRRVYADVTVVETREVSPPRGCKPLYWRLLTTQRVGSFEDALAVIDAYTKRWRIEDLHRAWKSGTCNIERSQLRSPAAFQRWATIAVAVAARAEQLRTMSRAAPDRRAVEVLTRDEVDAAILLSRTKEHRVGDDLSIERAVFLIACVGGYVGKHARTKPGVLNISRGLDRIAAGAEVIAKLNR